MYLGAIHKEGRMTNGMSEFIAIIYKNFNNCPFNITNIASLIWFKILSEYKPFSKTFLGEDFLFLGDILYPQTTPGMNPSP